MKERNSKVMKMHKKCKRLLALLLVWGMLLQQGGLTTFAEDAKEPNQRTEASDFVGGVQAPRR